MKNIRPFMNWVGLRIVLILLVTAICGVSAQCIDVLYGHEYAMPVDFRVHKDRVVGRFQNGRIALLNRTDMRWVRTGEEIEGYVDRIVTNTSSMWIHVSTGKIYGSEDGGQTWIRSDGEFSCIGEDANGSPVVVDGGAVYRLTIDSSRTKLVETGLTVGMTTLSEIAVKGDTVIVCLDDRTTVQMYMNGGLQRSFDFKGQTIHSFTFASSSQLHVVADGLYKQRQSLIQGFELLDFKLELSFVLSVSAGFEGLTPVAIVSGKEPRGFGYASSLRIYNAESMRYTRVSLGDSLGTVQAATMLNGSIIAANAIGGTFSRDSTGEWYGNERRFRNLGGRGEWSVSFTDTTEIITQTIPRTDADPPLLRLYRERKIYEPCENDPQLLDSIGSVIGVYSGFEGRQFLIGKDGWLIADRSGDRYNVGGRRQVRSFHETLSKKLVASFDDNNIAVSSDSGRTWSLQVIRSLFGGFLTYSETDSLHIIASGFGMKICRKSEMKDTLSPLQLPFRFENIPVVIQGSGLEYEAVGIYVDSLRKYYIRFDTYRLDTLIKSFDVPVNIAAVQPIYVQTIGDTIQIFHRFSGACLTFVDHTLIREVRIRSPFYSMFAAASSANVRFVSSDSVRIVLPSEGIASTFYVGTNPVNSIDQNIWHFYIQKPRPNPTVGHLTIDVGKFVTADRSTVRLQLWSIDGKFVQDYTNALPAFGSGNETHSITLDVSDVPAGLYLLVIRNSQNSQAEKVLIMK